MIKLQKRFMRLLPTRSNTLHTQKRVLHMRIGTTTQHPHDTLTNCSTNNTFHTVELHSEQRGGSLLVGGGVIAQPEVDDVLLVATAGLGVRVQQDVAVSAEEVSVCTYVVSA